MHDLGLTSSDKIPSHVSSLRQLLDSKVKGKKVPGPVIKTMHHLGFYSDQPFAFKKDATYLDVLSQVMGEKLALKDTDRDLIIMKHIFKIEDPKTKQKWEETSTLVVSGETKVSGGHSIMSKTVGLTCGIATRLVLEKKIAQRGVLSPIKSEIYDPIIDELEQKYGIKMKEESSL
jgi:saccharopine dehydrogenase (NADP+, L-glutamate forming)